MVKLQFCNRLNWFLPVVRLPQSEWLMTMFYDKVRVVPYDSIFFTVYVPTIVRVSARQGVFCS